MDRLEAIREPALTGMKITVLGSGNPAPSLKRMGSGYLISVGDDRIVFDHRPGSHHRLLQTGTRAVDITHAFFSLSTTTTLWTSRGFSLTRWDQGGGRIQSSRCMAEP